MKTKRRSFTTYIAGLAGFFVAAGCALAINVTEPPDQSQTPPGTSYTLDLGANTFSGSVNTTGSVDVQDNFLVTVPAGLRITAVSKNVTAVPGPAFDGFVTFNNNQSLSGTGAGNFITGLPFQAGFYQVTVAANFSVGNPWSVTVTTGPAPDYSVSTTGGVITVTDDAGNGDVLTVSEPVAGQIRFAAPGRTFAVNGGALITGDSGNLPLAGVTSIQVNAAAGNDTINVSAFSGTSFPDLQISGGPDDDTVNLNGDITFANNSDLSVSAETANVAANANLRVSKSGTIFVTCRRNVFLDGGSSLETENGTLSVQANQQTPALTGNFTGVNLIGATLRSTGTGAVTVKGRGGDDAGGSQLGVSLFNGAKIIGGSGAVNVTGTGGASTNWINRGVTVYGAGSQITSTGGGVTVTGTAGPVGSDYGIGVAVLFGGEISAGGTGAVSVTGTGTGAGAVGSFFNMGVEMGAPGSQITSAGGNVTVTGTAGVGASSGIYLSNSSAISTPLAGGSVTLEADSIAIDGTSSVTSASGTSTVTLQTHTTTTRLDLGGADDNASTPKVLGLADAEIDRITTPRLILSTASFSTFTISAPISPASARSLTLNTADASSPINATAAGTDITLPAGGILTLDGPLAMPITSATPDTGFPQLKVVGGVNLNGKALDLTGTTLAGTLGQTFTLIDNDGTDAVTGTFAGLAQNATLPWPPNPALSARISYTGGSGNDVTLTIVDIIPPVITAPANITDTATSPAGRVVIYFANASDGGGLASFTTVPPSGSTFPIGVTTVALNAQDNAGNTASASFTVTIVDPRLVTSTANDTSAGSLRAALTAVESWSGPDTITFAPALSGQTITLAGAIAIADTDAVTVDASNLTGGLTISGGNATRLFSVPVGKSLVLKNLTLTGGNGSGGNGGAISSAGTVTAEDCTFSANAVNPTQFFTGQGGAIHSDIGSTLTLTRCSFQANTAYEGGAVRSQRAALTATNCTFIGNSATIGGALSSADGGPATVLAHCTVTGNTATSIVLPVPLNAGGGGLFFFSKDVTLTNCLIAGNTAPVTFGVDVEAFGGVFTLLGNLIGNNDTVSGLFPAGPLVGTPAAPLAARLAPLASNGGPTQTLALLPGSPALDKGVVVPGLATDQRGFLRSRDGDVIAGALPDIGAYEAQAAPYAIGFNMGDGGVNGGDVLGAGDIAGVPVVAQGNWNHLAGPANSGGLTADTTPRFDATGSTVPGLKLWWKGPNTWRIGGAADTADKKLMFGYLDSNATGDGSAATDLFNTPAAQPYLAIAGLPAIVGGYRVLVYSDTDNIAGRISRYWLTSNRAQNPASVGSESALTGSFFTRDTANFTGTYTRATATTDTGATTPGGNYALFENITEPDGIIIRAEEGSLPATTQARAPINAVQIVRNEIVVVTTALDENDPIGTLGAGVSLREALRDAAPGSGIVFDPAVFNGEPADTITFLAANSGLVLDKDLTIDAGNIAGGVTINAAASNGNQKRIFALSAGRTAALLGLNLTGAYNTTLDSGYGGAIHSQGHLSLIACRITGNVASEGGAAYCHAATQPASTILRRCAVSGNQGLAHAGAIEVWADGHLAELHLEDSTLSGNTTPGYGGAVWTYADAARGIVTARRTTVTANQSDLGGAFNSQSVTTGSAELTLSHCTIAGNIASLAGGGILCGNTATPTATAPVTLAHTIIAGNSASSAAFGPDLIKDGANASFTSLGGNLIGKTDASGTAWLGSDLTGTAATPLAPLLAPLGNYGGPTQTMPPLPGSPAIDAAVGSAFTTDQRGFPITGTPDIGAVEIGTVTVTTATDELDPVGTPGTGVSLREALLYSAPGEKVVFDPILTGGTVIFSSVLGEMVLGKSVTIDASALSGGLTLDGGSGTNRIFSVSSGQSVVLKNLTLTGGNGVGAARNGDGGAILNLGTLTLERCTLSGNTAGTTPGGPELGGAIYSHTGASLTLKQCTLVGNQCISNRGGAVNSRGTLGLIHCTISGNTARFDGGGVRSDGPIALTNTIIAGNTLTTGAARDLYVGGTTLTRVGANIVPFFGSDGGAGISGPAPLTTDPLLAPLDNYGGPTKTMALKPASPARNAAGLISEVQLVSLSGNTSGTFTLTFDGATTASLAFNATAPTIESALNALATVGGVGGSVAVTRAGNVFTVTFGGTLAGANQPALTTAVSGGAVATIATILDFFLATSDQRGFPIVGGTPDLGAYEAGNQLATNFNAYIWETLPATATIAQHASGVDFDGDGITNGNEWLAQTHPGDPVNYLHITSLVRAGNDLSFTFPSVLGRNYTFEQSTDLVTWTTGGLTFPGTGSPIILNYPNVFTGNTRFFFRARVGP